MKATLPFPHSPNSLPFVSLKKYEYQIFGLCINIYIYACPNENLTWFDILKTTKVGHRKKKFNYLWVFYAVAWAVQCRAGEVFSSKKRKQAPSSQLTVHHSV